MINIIPCYYMVIYRGFSHREKWYLHTLKNMLHVSTSLLCWSDEWTICPWCIVETFSDFFPEIFGNDRKRSNDLRTTFQQFWSRFCFYLNEIYCYSKFLTVWCYRVEKLGKYDFFGKTFDQVEDLWVLKLQALFSFSTFEQDQRLF